MKKVILVLLMVLGLVSFAEAKVAIVRQALRSGTGTQDFTVNGFGVPTAALFFMNAGLTDGTLIEKLMHSVGCTDGTRQYTIANHDQDNVATTSSDNWLSSAAVVIAEIETTGNVEGLASFSAWVQDGVTINVSDAFTAAHFVTVVLFNQTVGAYCSIASLNATQDGTTDVTAPGFTPDVVFGFHRSNNAAVDAKDVDAHLGFGIAINDGSDTQFSYAFSANDGQAVTTDIDQRVGTNRIAVAVNSAGTFTYSVEVDAFDGSGFTLITRDAVSPSVSFLCYLALKYAPGFQQALAQLDSPTGTGTQSVTFPGFKPQFALTVVNNVTTVDSDLTTTGIFGFSLMTQNTQMSVGMWDEDNITLGVSNVGTISDDQAINVLDQAQASYFVATLTGFTSTGWDWSFSTTQAAARQWISYALRFKQEGSSNVYRFFR